MRIKVLRVVHTSKLYNIERNYMKNIYRIENDDSNLITVVLEPWCYEYYLEKKDILILEQEEGIEGYYHSSLGHYNEGLLMTIYVEGGYGLPNVYLNNSLIEAFEKKI